MPKQESDWRHDYPWHRFHRTEAAEQNQRRTSIFTSWVSRTNRSGAQGGTRKPSPTPTEAGTGQFAATNGCGFHSSPTTADGSISTVVGASAGILGSNSISLGGKNLLLEARN